jgi:hypothetical protein
MTKPAQARSAILGAAILSLIAAPFVYTAVIRNEHMRKCELTEKLVVHDQALLRDLNSLVARNAHSDTPADWYEYLSGSCYHVDQNVFAGSIPVGNYEYYIAIHKNGRLAARLYNVILKEPNWFFLFAINRPGISRDCAANSPQNYPLFWQLMHGKRVRGE